MKDWDKIVKDLSSGDESDENDIPNIASLMKNAPKNVRLISSLVDKNSVPQTLKKYIENATSSDLKDKTVDDFSKVRKKIVNGVKNEKTNTN